MKAIPGKYPLVALSEERKSHNEYQFDAKAVIVPLISSTGHGHASMKRVHYQEGKFALGNILCAVIPNDESIINSKYLHLYLQQFKDKLLVPLMKGAANVSLSMNKLAEVEIEVPTLEKQLQIISFESHAEPLKNALESKLQIQETHVNKLRHAFFREAMQGKLVKQDANDEPACLLLKRIKVEKEKLIKEKKLKKEKPLPPIMEDEIPYEIPKNWAWCRLGEICIHISDIDHKMPSAVSNGGIKFLSAKDLLDDGSINYTHNIKCISQEDFKRLGRKIIPQKYDIIYSRIGANLGKARIVKTNETFLVSYSCCTIRTLNPSVDFLAAILDSGFVLKQAKTNTTDHSIPDLGIQKIKEFLIPIPPQNQQQRIVSKMDQLMKYCNELEQSIKQSKEQTEQLLQVALKEALTPK